MTAGARILAETPVREVLESWVRDHGTLAAAAVAQPEVETLTGRGEVHIVPAPAGAGRWAIRHYHRGGAVASLLGDRYLRLGTPRPDRELAMGRALEAAGIPTPRHIGGAVYPHGVWYRGDLITEYVPDSMDLAAVLFGGAAAGHSVGAPPFDPAAAMRAAGALVRHLHDDGVVHRDLNLKNILIAGSVSGERGAGADGSIRALVLDLDRASLRSRVSERARRRMLERFWRSARKWEARTERVLEPVLRRAFEDGYGR